VPLRYDTFQPKLARMREHLCAVRFDVFAESDAELCPSQKFCKA